MTGDLDSLVDSPVPSRDEEPAFLLNEGFASRQRTSDKRPWSKREGLSKYADFFRPLSESFTTTYRGNNRPDGSMSRSVDHSLTLHLINEVKRSEVNMSMCREGLRMKEKVVGYWEAKSNAWADRGELKKLEIAEAQKKLALKDVNDRIDWIIAEEMRIHDWRVALRQFSQSGSEAETRPASRHGSAQLAGPPPTSGEADTFVDEVFERKA